MRRILNGFTVRNALVVTRDADRASGAGIFAVDVLPSPFSALEPSSCHTVFAHRLLYLYLDSIVVVYLTTFSRGLTRLVRH